VSASELIVGEIAYTPYGKQLEALGVKVCRGAKNALAKELVDAGYYLMLLYLECPCTSFPAFARDYKPTAICHLQRFTAYYR